MKKRFQLGRLHTAALEPWTSYPTDGLAQAVKNDTALVLQPGEKISTTIKAVAFDGMSLVDSSTLDGEFIGKNIRILMHLVSNLNSQERVHAVIRREKPDRIPKFEWDIDRV